MGIEGYCDSARRIGDCGNAAAYGAGVELGNNLTTEVVGTYGTDDTRREAELAGAPPRRRPSGRRSHKTSPKPTTKDGCEGIASRIEEKTYTVKIDKKREPSPRTMKSRGGGSYYERICLLGVIT